MLTALRRWIFGRPSRASGSLWQVLVLSEGKTYRVGTPFRAETMEEAQAEARERGELFIAELVMKKGGIVFARYGFEEVRED